MRLRVSVKVSGLEAIKSDLQAKSRRLLDEVTAFGIAEAKKNAPVKTSHLRRSIHVLEDGNNAKRYGTAVVYARIQEYGGEIRPKRKKYLRFKVNGQWVFAKRVRIKGKFYMKRSAEAARQAIKPLGRKIFGG